MLKIHFLHILNSVITQHISTYETKNTSILIFNKEGEIVYSFGEDKSFFVTRILAATQYYSKLIFEETNGVKTIISPAINHFRDIEGYVIICVDAKTNNFFQWHLIIELLTVLMSVSWSYPNIFNLDDIDNLTKTEFTAREKQIIDLLRCGFKDQYIADKLYISLPTVRKYLRTIYDKSGVSSKSQFIAIYYQKQLPK